MKHLFYFLFAATCWLAQFPLTAQRLVCTPANPLPGEKITLHYHPAGSPLEGESTIEAVAFLLENETPRAVEINLQAQGDTYAAVLETTMAAKAVVFAFANVEAEKYDNNADQGYVFGFYQKDRKSQVQGALDQQARFHFSWAHLGGLKSNPVKAMELLRKEFELFPASKNNTNAALTFAKIAMKQKDQTATEEVKSQIAALLAQPKATEADLTLASKLSQSIGEAGMMKAADTRLREKYPKGAWQKDELFANFKKSTDVAEKVKLYEQFKKQFAKDKDFDRMNSDFALMLASLYAKSEEWDNFKKYYALSADPVRKAGALNQQAWTLAGGGLGGDAKNAALASELSKKSLEFLQQEMATPVNKPAQTTDKAWQKNLSGNYAGYADTYALALFRTGNAAEALKYQQIACDENHFGDGEMNERYCAYLEGAKGSKEAEMLLAKLIADGTSTAAMKEQHKRLFIANNSVESAYEQFAASLDARATDRLKEKLREKMLDQPGAPFRLLDLDGKEVSLESMKGKVVVLDFWATWCGPCKASFPGMQQAVTNHAGNPDVQFLFVDTWEKGDNKQKNAADFIAEKKYPFHVLLDDKDEVVAKYGVSGIPTKFILDKNGVIRFKSIGFSGNNDELVKELSLMIEMAGGAAVQGAP